MTNEQIKKLDQIHATLGLIHCAYGPKMTAGEETLFARALEELFDLIAEESPNEPAPGSEWPATLDAKWRALK